MTYIIAKNSISYHVTFIDSMLLAFDDDDSIIHYYGDMDTLNMR